MSTYQEKYNELLAETATITWQELQRFFAMGRLILVEKGHDLVKIATDIAMDDVSTIEQAIQSKQLTRVTDEMAIVWSNQNCSFWAVVASPWVFIEEIVYTDRDECDPCFLRR